MKFYTTDQLLENYLLRYPEIKCKINLENDFYSGYKIIYFKFIYKYLILEYKILLPMQMICEYLYNDENLFKYITLKIDKEIKQFDYYFNMIWG